MKRDDKEAKKRRRQVTSRELLYNIILYYKKIREVKSNIRKTLCERERERERERARNRG